jgi:hypothetical protein
MAEQRARFQFIIRPDQRSWLDSRAVPPTSAADVLRALIDRAMAEAPTKG